MRFRTTDWSYNHFFNSDPWPLAGHPEAMKMSCRQGYFHTSTQKMNSANFALTEFSEVRRFFGALTCFVPWSTYTILRQAYAAFVTWPAVAA
jgi:hypothetical protein